MKFDRIVFPDLDIVGSFLGSRTDSRWKIYGKLMMQRPKTKEAHYPREYQRVKEAEVTENVSKNILPVPSSILLQGAGTASRGGNTIFLLVSATLSNLLSQLPIRNLPSPSRIRKI